MLTRENYHSKEMNEKYMGVSQLKSFINCQAGTMDKLKNQNDDEEKSTALLVGSYVDAHFSKEMDLFRAKNPSMISTRGKSIGKPKAEYKSADDIISRIERDELFMEHMSGKPQVIKTGFIDGVEFKVMADSLHKDKIVDLKIMKDFKAQYKDGLYLNFIEFWGYDIQAAIYQEVFGGNLPFIIAVATKESTPDLALLEIPQERMDYCLDLVRNQLEDIMLVKNGLVEPVRCENCSYCKSTKKLTEVIPYDEFFGNC